MKKILKRYSIFITLVLVNLAILMFVPATGFKSLQITGSNALQMLSVIPPIFLLLGLLDVWVKKETMVKLMGEKSKLKGILIALVLGSAAAGPIYAAFPVAAMLLKKGSKFSNVLIFLGAWSTTKIPLLLFETSAMGLKFMLLRFALDIPVIFAIAYITKKLLKKEEIEQIYAKAELMSQ
jgi:uncharacterized membrane protein YraQ (UPF0718 family)